MKNRPRKFVSHCLNRMPPKVGIPYGKEDVQEIENGTFLVPSFNKEDEYYLLRPATPSCSCPDFSFFHLPCKHFLALLKFELISWEDFPAEYRDAPMINVDTSFIQAPQNPRFEENNNEKHVPEEPVADPTTVLEEQNCVTAKPSDSRELLKELDSMTYILEKEHHSDLRSQLLTLLDSFKAKLPTSSGLIRNEPLPKRIKRAPRSQTSHDSKDGKFIYV